MRASAPLVSAPLALLALLAGCDAAPADAPTDAAADAMGGGGADAAGPDAGPPGPENAVPADDPRFAGQQRFLHETWGGERFEGWPPADFMLALMRDEPEVFGNQFEGFGFVPDPADDLPYGFKRGAQDPTRVAETCALCHVARLPDGRLWLGAPNPALDLGRFRLEVARRWAAAGQPPLDTPLALEKAAVLGPGRTGAESGDYPVAVPADFPPYFRLGQRRHLNHLGTGRDLRTEVYLSIYSTGPGNPSDATSPAGPFPGLEVLDPFIEFLGGLEPPPAPPQEAAAVARGAEVFARAGCGDCHHPDAIEADGVTPLDQAEDGRDRHPGEDPAWPDGSIHTSPLHRVLVDGDGEGGGLDAGRLALLGFIGRHRLAVGITDGYRVPLLAGLWASAPYLHNGSVPTLDDLLRPPAERPVRFEHAGATRDTTLEGNLNRGHAFGTDLSPAEKADLIAWLLSR